MTMIITVLLYLLAGAVFVAVLLVAWFFLDSPLRYMFILPIRYALRGRLDYLLTIGRSPVERYRLEVLRSYEQLVDIVLLMQAAEQHYQHRLGISWKEDMLDGSDDMSNEIAKTFLSLSNQMLVWVALHLCREKFQFGVTPMQVFEFLIAERRLIADDPASSLGHVERLWDKFGQGPMYGWRLPYLLPRLR
jgi:hypothetical protein